jgi:hypothetical protein
MLALHCSRIVAICLHVLQALTALPVRTSYRPIVAQVSGISVTCGHALKTRESSRIGRPFKPFFILEVCGPQSCEICCNAGALPSREAGPDAVGHVAASEPSRAGR